MVLTIPDSLKIITPYIRRAEELDKDPSSSDYKVVSYYCKKYALEQAIKLKINSPEVNKFMSTVLASLEKDKPELGVTTEQAPIVCENFAYSVFSRADEEDRQGLASKTTAKVFYSAATFYDILEQFGELDEETKEKRKYCKYKAADILNAINEGRKPTPGGYEESQDTAHSLSFMSIPEAPVVNIPTTPPVQSQYQSQTTPVSTMNYGHPNLPIAPPMYPYMPNTGYSAPMSNSGGNSNIVNNNGPSSLTYQSRPNPQPMNRPPPNHISDPRVKDAMEVCMFAVAALKQNDVPLAKQRLEEALRRLNAL